MRSLFWSVLIVIAASTIASVVQSPTPSRSDRSPKLQEQAGLKLRPGKALLDVVVIDHLERPAEN